ncbi:MAG: hydrolase [Tepidisphaeraceae bacterium]|jgi:nicotinamidase-related amidase
MNDLLRKLTPQGTVLLVVDVQEKLLPAIHEAEVCAANVRKMVEAAKVLALPVVVTEQYPAGLGPTCASIREALGDEKAIEKVRFSACVEATMARLRELDRRQVIVVGIETHVCVQQTVLDLLRLDYNPYVCADAVSSRRAMDRDTGMARMRQAGAVITTTESAIFELVGEAGTSQFKQVLKIVK